jgi:hypothetical protein
LNWNLPGSRGTGRARQTSRMTVTEEIEKEEKMKWNSKG